MNDKECAGCFGPDLPGEHLFDCPTRISNLEKKVEELTGHLESLDALFEGDFGLPEIAQAMITIEIALGIHEKRTAERRLLDEKTNKVVQFDPKRIIDEPVFFPCTCGNAEAYWHGHFGEERAYCCDECWDFKNKTYVPRYTDCK